MVLSPANRYMHSASETVDLTRSPDVERIISTHVLPGIRLATAIDRSSIDSNPTNPSNSSAPGALQ